MNIVRMIIRRGGVSPPEVEQPRHCIFLRYVINAVPYTHPNVVNGKASPVILPQRAGSLGTPLSGRWFAKQTGGVVPYPIRRRHITSSLLPLTYYFLRRTVGDAGPYNAIPFDMTI